jgi:hypothetical protein
MSSKKISPALRKRMAAVPLGWPSPNLTAQPEMFVKKLITDLHGPLLRYDIAVCEVAKGLFGVHLTPEQVRHYNMAYDANFPLSPVQFNRVFQVITQMSRGGYSDLPIREDAVEQFKLIKAAGIPIEVWTYVPGALDHDHETLKSHATGIAQRGTRDLIASMGIVDDVMRQVRFVRPDAKPYLMAEEHLPLIVEDNPVTALAAGYAFGNAAILTPEPYNEHLVCPGVLRLNDISELAPTVIDFFEKLEAAGAILGGMR